MPDTTVMVLQLRLRSTGKTLTFPDGEPILKEIDTTEVGPALPEISLTLKLPFYLGDPATLSAQCAVSFPQVPIQTGEVKPVFVGGSHKIAEAIQSAFSPAGSVDANDCDKLTGWAVDKGSPETPQVVQITCDGLYVGQVTTTIPRSDVKTYLTGQGVAINTQTLGWQFFKPAGFKDGKAHTWRALLTFVGQYKISGY